VDAHNAALNDIEAFPAQCCTPLPPRAVENILTHEVIAAYKAKAQEYNTHPVLRVYCVNDDCSMFIPAEKFEDHSLSTVAPYVCGTKTCVGCKEKWKGDRHKCPNADGPGAKPDCMPAYAPDCRIKQCPACRKWVELREACNHMTCGHCRHKFCFVCLKPWGVLGPGFHQQDGCPTQGDPPGGYDDEGFEVGGRGLHRDIGYNRDGLDRFGLPRMSQVVGNAHFSDELGIHPPMVNFHDDIPGQLYILGAVEDDESDSDSDSDSEDEEEYLDPDIAYAPRESDNESNAGTIGSAGDVGEQEEHDGHTREKILDALFKDDEDAWGDDEFAVALMFDVLEFEMREMREEYWAVVENDVDEPGFHLTFHLWTNPYTPLYWDEDTDA
jgi:hypothetical protein